ncbi:triosephosphate isomerase [Natrarchaeobius halalkaliphilus]|uniref:Triosephosphate isomerase n=1 Tax=Natrarchaeobius halalkaliphilus TaxID=1679091 RepID=A0A3N6NYV6_9EURY|nr:triose-phosphate isomerase [Natrarchaeobius halalkaliphilus]RQG90059.1 triosephosphate isomerase [Natrarchaeobius halalkaliphilus]
MTHTYPYFGVNFKVYPNTIGEGGLELAKTVERVHEETGANFVVTPQIPDLRLITSETDLTVSSPHVDPVSPGRGIGKVLPETLADAGIAGATINHAENRDTLTDIAKKIDRCNEVGLDSSVCVDSIEMGEAVAAFDPDALIYEKPEDISTDRAITTTHPERVERFVEMIESTNPRTKVLVGGGIRTAEHVRAAFELGADATGAASAISTADDPYERLTEIAGALPE